MSTSKTWPGGATGATPTAYSIPAAGELNWASLSNLLIALADGAQCTTFQKFAVRKAVATPITVATSDCIVVSDLTVAAAVAVSLPAGANKQIFFVVDGKGDAGTNNITITPNGAETIGGAATLVLSGNGEGVGLIYNSSDTDWKIFTRYNRAGTAVGGFTASRAIVSSGAGVLEVATTTATQIGYLSAATGTTGTTSTNLVFSTSPTLVTPVLGVATATSINKVAITAPASSATLTLADGSSLITSGAYAITLTSTGATGVTLPTTGTLATLAGTETFTNKTLTSPKLNENVAVTTTATKLNYITSATGTTGTASTNIVFSTSPTLVTPVLGAATATSINGLTITSSTGTLTITNSKTLSVSNTLTFTGTDASSVAFGTGGTVAYTSNKLSAFAATTSLELAGVISDETGSGALCFATSPTFVTEPVLQGNLMIGTTATSTGLSSTAYRYVGNKAASLTFSDSAAVQLDVNAGIYYDGALKYTTLNQTGGIFTVVRATALANTVFQWNTGTSVSHAADSAATTQNVGTINGNGLWTLGLSGGTQQHVINGSLSVVQGQIKFPATQVASSDVNTLDDYEEGTWSPTITASGGGTMVVVTQQGSYVKIGKAVIARAYLAFNDNDLSGNFSMSLPVAAENVSNTFTAVIIPYWSGWTTSMLNMSGLLSPGGSTFAMYKMTAAATGSNTTLTNSDSDASCDLCFTICYNAAT